MITALLALLARSPPQAVARPLLPEGLYCANATVRTRAFAYARPADAAGREDGGAVPPDVECDPRVFSPEARCCEHSDVAAVLEHLEGSLQFALRHISDREAFQEQYRRPAFGDHPCAPAAEAMVAARVQQLAVCHTVSETSLALMRASVQQLLCAACYGQIGGGVSQEVVAVEEALAAEWRRLSVAVADMHRELRLHDAALSKGLREAGLAPPCATEYVEALRRGVPAPSSHAVPLRPWSAAGGGVRGFQELWRQWIDGLLAVGAEYAEGLVAEVQGLLLALHHSLRPETAAHMLVSQAPPPLAERPVPRSTSAGPVNIADNGPPASLGLLVVLPNPSTNLRFDFARDPTQLSMAILTDHMAALKPLLAVPSARVAVVTANPEQAAAAAEALQSFAVTDGAGTQVVWRRFALFQPDELATLLLLGSNPRPGAGGGATPRAAAVFEVPPSTGAAKDLAAAARLLAGPEAVPPPSAWPAPLRPVRPVAPWPSLLATTIQDFGQVPAGALPAAAVPAVAGAAGGAGGWRRGWDASGCPRMAALLGDYLGLHASVVARLRAVADAVATGTSSGAHGDVVEPPTERVLIYRCSSLGFCGGHGDRLNGILGVFLLAVASRRAFFIEAPRPVSLHLLLGPRRRPHACVDASGGEFLLDWRIHGAVGAPGRQANYNDRYNDIIEDVPWLLLEEEEPVVVLRSNQRITGELLRRVEAQASMGTRLTRELLSTPYLHADLMELLFEPTPLLATRQDLVATAARGGRRWLIAIHFRAGDRSPGRWSDPPRHSLSALSRSLACARDVERRLGWRDEDVAWYLAADTSELQGETALTELRERGKLAFLPAGHDDSSIIHLDRSSLNAAVEGLTDTWAQWFAIAAADAVVLSASNFGVTAAEAGRVRHAFLGPHGCIEADLTAV